MQLLIKSKSHNQMVITQSYSNGYIDIDQHEYLYEKEFSLPQSQLDGVEAASDS